MLGVLGGLGSLGSLSGGLGALTQAPLTKAAIRYWWVALPLGWVAWHSYQKRKVKGKIDPTDLINDIAPAATLAMSLVLLDLGLRAQAAGQPMPVGGLAPAPAPRPRPQAPIRPTGPVTDAEFVPKPPPTAGARHGLV